LIFYIFCGILLNSQFKTLERNDTKWQNAQYVINLNQLGNKLSIARSHISKRSKRTWKPNLQSVKVMENGQAKRIKVCTKCLRSGKVNRV